MAVVPVTFYQGDVALEDTSQAEGIPVRQTRLKVTAGTAAVFSDHSVSVQNGGFETVSGTTVSGWGKIGTLYSIDNAGAHGGSNSIRIENPAGYTSVNQTITGLKPFRAYELSVWIKTQGFTASAQVGFDAWSTIGNRGVLHRRDFRFCPWKVKRNQAWKRHTNDFNSVDAEGIKLRLVASTGKATGKIWFDDVVIREVALYETIRRPSCPVTVTSEDGNTTYLEGSDYTVKETPYVCCSCNEDQGLVIPAGSRIQEGQLLRVNWYQHGNVETLVAPASFCSAEAWEITRRNIVAVDSVFDNPRGMNVYLDEWRVAGWDPVCMATYESTGEYMGKVAQIHTDLLKGINSNREVYIPHDMYDPYFNAKPNYSITNGGTDSSWLTLPDSTILWNWSNPNNNGTVAYSVRFFAGLDPKYPDVFFRQIVYAHGAPVAQKWEDTLTAIEKEGARGIVGFAFVTWKNDFTNIEAAANVFVQSGRWGTGPIPFPPVGVQEESATTSNEPMGFGMSLANGRLEYHLTRNALVKIRIANSLGQTIWQEQGKRHMAGKYEMDVRELSLAAGLYAISLDVGEIGDARRMTKKMVVF